MSAVLRRWLPLIAVTAIALWLRTFDLVHRPMHADEANQALKFGELLETGRYAFDPHDHHGPTLYYATLPIAWIRGETKLVDVDEVTLRLVPAIAGTLAVLFLGLMAAPLGRWPAVVAAALLAISPPALYYSRDYIQETLLLAFTLATFLLVRIWWNSGRVAAAIGAGGCIGLMLATKASAPLFLAAGLLAGISIQPGKPVTKQIVRDGLLALVAALGVGALLYSSFGTHFAGVEDAFRAYGFAAQRVSAGSGHEKPWWYYFQLFAWKQEGGLVWQQLAFLALAAFGAALAFSTPADEKSSVSSFARRALLYTAVLALALSAAPYKTPWHAIHWVPGLAVLAAAGLALLPRWWTALVLAVVVLWSQALQSRLAVFQRPADERNPYAYVQSSPDVLKFRPLVNRALARDPNGVVRVISEEYWPLPWYFRGLDHVGYWNSVPADCDAAVVITSTNLADGVRQKLHASYDESYLGLRPGFMCVVFTRKS
jgi:uncharacterized protein (TIGR03663 family)